MGLRFSVLGTKASFLGTRAFSLGTKAVRALGCALVLTACASPIRVEHDSDPTADFASYRSFAWISENPLMGPRPGVAGGEYISPVEGSRNASQMTVR